MWRAKKRRYLQPDGPLRGERHPLAGLGELHCEALFARRVGLSVNTVHEAYMNRPGNSGDQMV
jgi:hypothetical protein